MKHTTCNGCKALVPDFHGGQCELGYELTRVFYTEGEHKGWLKKHQPLEDCPKPMTNKAWCNAAYKR
jgi:hypothetical protein